MKRITIQLALNNTPDVPPINSVQIIISYDTKVLNATDNPYVSTSNLDYSSNVFSQTPYPKIIVADCLDGHAANGQPTGACGADDGPGRVSFAESILGGTTPDGTQGNVFFLSFAVNTAVPALTQIQIVRAILGNGQLDPDTQKPFAIPVTTVDGYYISKQCGNVACAPAVARFTWSPQTPKQGKPIVFNGSASRPSPGESIKNYTWAFDDPQSSRPNIDTGTNATAIHIYQLSGTYSVTLKINDTAGIRSAKTQLVVVVNEDKIVGIESLEVQPNAAGVLPGTVFNIKAVLRNYGGVPINASMTITLATNPPKLLKSLPLTFMKPSATVTLSATWDSAGYAPNVYRIDAATPVLVNQTRTDNNHKSVWVLLVYPAQNGLNLLTTAGIAIFAVGAGGYGVSFLRKRNPNLDDAL